MRSLDVLSKSIKGLYAWCDLVQIPIRMEFLARTSVNTATSGTNSCGIADALGMLFISSRIVWLHDETRLIAQCSMI